MNEQINMLRPLHISIVSLSIFTLQLVASWTSSSRLLNVPTLNIRDSALIANNLGTTLLKLIN
jgi:hypothetical protein